MCIIMLQAPVSLSLAVENTLILYWHSRSPILTESGVHGYGNHQQSLYCSATRYPLISELGSRTVISAENKLSVSLWLKMAGAKQLNASLCKHYVFKKRVETCCINQILTTHMFVVCAVNKQQTEAVYSSLRLNNAMVVV